MTKTKLRPLAVIAGMSGNLIEWYDFGLYGVLAAMLGKLFFPDEHGFVGLLSVYGVFAAGYIARLAGGTIFGHIGDRFGRRRALLLSAVIMAVATFLVGCLPTYASIGVTAPVLFTIFRLLQGLSVGGEFTTSLSYLVEHAPEKHRAFQGAFACLSATTGILLGSATGNLLFSVYTVDQILDWAWRIPFLLSLPMGIVIAVLRRVLPADPPIEEFENQPAPFVRVVRRHPGLLLRGTFLGWGVTVAFYISAVFLSSFLVSGRLVDQKTALQMQTLTVAVMIFFTPLGGYLADRFGRRKMVLGSSLAFAAFSFPLFLMLEKGGTTVDFWALGIFGFFIAMGFAPYQVWLAEQFPASLRASGLGIAYNAAAGIFGGATPLIATALVQFSDSEIAPAALVLVSALTTFFVALFMDETKGETLR